VLKKVQVEIEDPNVKAAIDKKKSDIQRIEEFKTALEKRVKELDEEKETIVRVSASFANFLRKNAISAYNDDLVKYLDHLIREEEGKYAAGGGKNGSVLEGLRSMKQSYEEQKSIYEEVIKSSGSSDEIQPSQIDGFIRELYDLKHHGKQLKDIVDKVQYGQRGMIKFREENHQVSDSGKSIGAAIKNAYSNLKKNMALLMRK